jgi:tetratricopeptide (TPR) repeat protein
MDEEDRLRFDEALQRHRAGHPDLAEPVYRELIKAEPENAELHHLLGVVNFQKGDPDQAIDWVEKAIALDGREAKYANTLGGILLAMGRFTEAETALRNAIGMDPVFADAHFNFGNALRALGQIGEAEAAYRQSVELEPGNVDALNNLGGLLKDAGRREDALEFLRTAAAIEPSNESALFNLTDCLERLNLLDDAAAAAENFLAVAPASPAANILMARLERRAGKLEAALARLEGVARTAPDAVTSSRAHFAIGQILDLLDDTERAFEAFCEANRLVEGDMDRRAAGRDAFLHSLERERAWFTPERLTQSAPARLSESRDPPVFLVGFPRSGTTLFEQILNAHPGLMTTGEASPLAYLKSELREGGDYPNVLDSASDGDVERWRGMFHDWVEEVFGSKLTGKRLVDKSPLNILDVGLIGRVFPDARIIVSLRDPRDACLSCFMQQFQPTDAMSNFTSLAATVDFYDQVMGGWLNVRGHTPVAWMDYRYEDLIADFEAVTRRALEFMDVAWDDAVLEYRAGAVGRDISTPSYQNVVEPLYSRAHGRWRRYQSHLAEHMAVLQPFVSEFGYDD